MTDKDTGEVSGFGNIQGDKLYEQRARSALPILVRQAKAQQPIYYSDLAAELGMPNPRNLNFVLGLIGNELQKLEPVFGKGAPPIQCCVINKVTELPGNGIGWFVPDTEAFKLLSRQRKRELISQMLNEVYAYPHWDEVLDHFGLKPAKPYSVAELTKKTSTAGGRGGSGEGELHKALKENIADNPNLVGLKKPFEIVQTEYPFLSGDVMDISLKGKDGWVGVEVKGRTSDLGDLTRGLFQCVKYAALMEAEKMVQHDRHVTNVILALGGAFPAELVAMKNMLGIQVVDRLQLET